MPNAQSILKSLNSALKACFEPIFENIPIFIESFRLLKFFDLKKNLVTNYFPMSLEEAKAFLQNIMQKFS